MSRPLRSRWPLKVLGHVPGEVRVELLRPCRHACGPRRPSWARLWPAEAEVDIIHDPEAGGIDLVPEGDGVLGLLPGLDQAPTEGVNASLLLELDHAGVARSRSYTAWNFRTSLTVTIRQAAPWSRRGGTDPSRSLHCRGDELEDRLVAVELLRSRQNPLVPRAPSRFDPAVRATLPPNRNADPRQHLLPRVDRKDALVVRGQAVDRADGDDDEGGGRFEVDG